MLKRLEKELAITESKIKEGKKVDFWKEVKKDLQEKIKKVKSVK